jgi:hypothetical protein
MPCFNFGLAAWVGVYRVAGRTFPTGPNQLRVGDITYIRIVAGFIYLAEFV